MNNEIILQRLKKYFHQPVYVAQSSEYLQYNDIKTYDFVIRGTEELAGRCELNRWGRLIHFEIMMSVVLSDNELTEEELIDIAREFVREFYPDICGEYELSAVFNMRELYSIYFEKKDDCLQVTIPYVGFNVGVAVDGQIVDFSFDYPKYKIEYLDEMITHEEAKKKFMNHIDLELAIEYCDKSTYINGDNNYHLLYKVNRSAPSIPATGEVRIVSNDDKFDYVPIEYQRTSFSSLYEALGISKYYHKIGEQSFSSGKIEAYSKLLQVGNLEYSMFLPDDHVIKIAYDWQGKVKHILSGEFTSRLTNKLSVEEAREKALDFLFFIEPEADEKFYRRIHQMQPVNDEELQEHFMNDEQSLRLYSQPSHEEMYRFLFQRVQSGIFVSDHFITIGIGKYTGQVRFLQNTIRSETALSHIDLRPKVSKEEALAMYDKALRMELSLLPQFQGDLRVYQPGYLAKFDKEHHFVEAVDAHTGKLYEIDLNDPIPY